jgi:hypothetical protein
LQTGICVLSPCKTFDEEFDGIPLALIHLTCVGTDQKSKWAQSNCHFRIIALIGSIRFSQRFKLIQPFGPYGIENAKLVAA